MKPYIFLNFLFLCLLLHRILFDPELEIHVPIENVPREHMQNLNEVNTPKKGTLENSRRVCICSNSGYICIKVK